MLVLNPRSSPILHWVDERAHADLAGIHAVARTELGSSRRFNPDVHADFAGKTHMASLVLAAAMQTSIPLVLYMHEERAADGCCRPR